MSSYRQQSMHFLQRQLKEYALWASRKVKLLYFYRTNHFWPDGNCISVPKKVCFEEIEAKSGASRFGFGSSGERESLLYLQIDNVLSLPANPNPNSVTDKTLQEHTYILYRSGTAISHIIPHFLLAAITFIFEQLIPSRRNTPTRRRSHTVFDARHGTVISVPLF